MSSMNNLDLMVQQISATPEDYDENRALISMHLNGNLTSRELPVHIQQVLFDWEIEEMKLSPRDIPQPWEENDG